MGTDIVPISRIDHIISDKGERFLNHVFTKAEQSICSKKAAPAIHYGGKFAAKEAVKKAILSTKIQSFISLRTIEITNDADGEPTVQIIHNGFDCQNIKVSISHAGDYAIATAILELK